MSKSNFRPSEPSTVRSPGHWLLAALLVVGAGPLVQVGIVLALPQEVERLPRATENLALFKSKPLRSRTLSAAKPLAQTVLAMPPGETRGAAAQMYGNLPLRFEVNEGQADEQVRFISRGRRYTLFLTGSEAVLALQGRQSPPPERIKRRLQETMEYKPRATDKLFAPSTRNPKSQIENLATLAPSTQGLTPSVLRLKLVGVNPNARIRGLEELPGKSNYFIGNNPKKWRTNVANYAKVKYENVYRGIDLVYSACPDEVTPAATLGAAARACG